MLLYRTARPEDTDQLQALAIRSYNQFSGVLTSDNWAVFNGNLHKRETFVNLVNVSKCFVCEEQDKIVGMAFLVPSGNPWDVFQADWCYIRLVGVDPARRGDGIAKELTKRCIEFARQSGEKTIALHTSEFMDAARHIYESVGFKVVKEIEPRYGKRYWLYRMVLS